ncbi:hypothetical protein [Saccharothrix sp. Mg75]|uniref:hypothetical protein n=1 Tax=Saccharothrix sp. Mg75 TaxID=3445357 RepID=UPI003EEB5ADC
MRYRGFGALLSARLDALTPERACLVQEVLRGVEPAVIHSRHASALAGLVTELPRLHAALEHHHVAGQPQKHLVDRLCENVLGRLGASTAAWGRDVLDPVADLVRGVRAAVAASTGDGEALLPPLHDAVSRLGDRLALRFAEVWEHPDGSVDAVADEVACLLAVLDRDPVAAESDLARLDRWDAGSVWRTLRPEAAPHRVALVVRGAGVLAELDAFDPTAAQAPLRSARSLRWGPATPGLRAFVDTAPAGGEVCVVSLEVRAVDRPAAARKAHRALVELLDQYTAGTRLFSPVVDQRVLVNRVGEAGTEQWRPPARSTPVARPLTRRELPDEVRRALRMAHVAAGAPAVASALAWSALEACGLVRRPELAAALAVQSLRQQVVGAYRLVRQSAAARLAQSRQRVAAAERVARHRAAALAARPDRPVPAHPVGQPDVAAARAEHAALSARITAALAVIGAHVRHDERHHLHDLGTWTDLLRPPGRDPEPLVAARAALDDLLPLLHPLAVREVARWRAALAAPEVLAAGLRDRTARTTTVLDALYATRNLTLHSGLAGDEPVHAVGAVMVTDLALEVLGNWYAHAPDPGTPPAEVIADLARRHHAILSRLAAGTRPARLDFDRLTSPGTTGVWRPR